MTLRDPLHTCALIVCGILACCAIWWASGLLCEHHGRQSEARCRRQIETGYVLYECRHYWDLCALNYNDCKSGERYEWERVSENGWRARQVP